MATVTLLLKKNYKDKNDEYALVIRLSSGKKQLIHHTGYKLKEHQFKKGQVVKHKDSLIINSKVSEKLSNAKKYISDCKERNRPIDFDLIFRKRQSHSFIEFLQERSKFYRERGMIVMRQKVDRFVKELNECLGEVYFDDFHAQYLETYELYLQRNSNSANTRHKKFEFLGKFFQDAIRDGKTDARNPFREYKIKTVPTRKEKLTPAQIELIEKLPLVGAVNDARNIFLFSYYARGMRFENCVTLKKSDIRDGRIYYQSNKGKKHLSLPVHSRMQKILDWYLIGTGKIIFPYLKSIPEDPQAYRSAIGSANTIVNRNLKIVAGLTEPPINITLSMHIARHSFSYHMKGLTENILVIQDMLGHSNARTTEIYLRSLDDKRLDSEAGKLYGN